MKRLFLLFAVALSFTVGCSSENKQDEMADTSMAADTGMMMDTDTMNMGDTGTSTTMDTVNRSSTVGADSVRQ